MTMEYKLAGRDGRGRRWSPGTPESRAWEVVHQMAAQAKAAGVTLERKQAPRHFDTMRAEFNRLYGSQATATPARDLFSVYEITPQGQWLNGQVKHHTDDLVRYLASELGLQSLPRVRWFGEAVRGAKAEPGWTLWDLNGRNLPWGFFDSRTREVWVKDGLSYEDERYVLAHELRHAWQIDTYGPAYFNEHCDGMEADATAYGEKYR